MTSLVARGARNQLAVLAVAMIFGMTPWFSATAVAPSMTAEWRAGDGVHAWLTVAVQLGFVLGTLISAILLLSDRLSARKLAAVSSMIVAGATALLTWRQVGPVSAICLRGVTGIALAGVYPPGIKIAAGWWRERRGTAIGVLVGALTVGSAAPNLFRFRQSSSDWREVILVAAAAALLSAALFSLAIREGPYQAPSAPFDPRALSRVLRDRGVMLATAGYLGHMWELYAMWSSIGAFWTYVVAERGTRVSLAPMLAFATIAVGAIGCVIAGLAADRMGRAPVTMIAMALSGGCALIVGFLTRAPLAIVITLALVWGASIVADSAQFSASVTELAPARYVGTAITMQTCVGFLLTIVTIRLVPVWVDWWGWGPAYMILATGPAVGIAAMWRLWRRSPGS